MKKYYESRAKARAASRRPGCCLICALLTVSVQCLVIAGIVFAPTLLLPYLVVSNSSPPADVTPHATILAPTTNSRNVSSAALAPDNRPLEGVAVTLMLHAPRWFQRRYTVMVQNVLANLPPRWRVQIFSTGRTDAGLEINPGLKNLIDKGVVEYTLLPSNLIPLKKKELMTHEWLWEHMLADKVLVFGGNSAICGNSPYSLNEFLRFDWLGAPWDAYQGRGGEGGLSLRSRRVMLEVIRRELQRNPGSDPNKLRRGWGYEDQFFVSRLIQMEKEGVRLNIADRNSTLRFASSGKYATEGSFAAFMTLAELDYEHREDFLSYCLELKMIFPSLHDPNCFGAHPNPELCKKSICALQEPLVGGC